MTYNKQQSVDAIRVLGIDAIEKSKSGHPGVVLGAAPMAYSLWSEHMHVNPSNPEWFNRDRFVLAAGHGSMLLYALLHLSGFDTSMEDIKNFRQWDSKTPGHPEYGHTAGIDATSGPLGQGIPMGVGMALAEAHLAAKYNKAEYNVVDHFTYVLCGDGDLMEGVTAEAASFAGHQQLGKLVVMYDSNDICLDGELDAAMTENVRARFDAYGWQTLLVEDGNDLTAISRAITEAKADLNRPTLIEVKTIIGYGAGEKAGTNAVHGAPLGEAGAVAAKETYNWNLAPFEISEEIYADYKEAVAMRGAKANEEWNTLFANYAAKYPEQAKELEDSIAGKLPVNLADVMPKYEVGFMQATRNSSHDAINALAGALPNFLGGSADLAHSNMTMIKTDGLCTPQSRTNRNIQYGVREFAMAVIMNGIALHKGIKTFGSTFFVFSDYLKPAVRMAALMGLPVTYVLTHDSIAVGEDGPTHEPIEQLAGLRAIPNVNVLRPADAMETQQAWLMAIRETKRPTILVLTRQNLPVLETTGVEISKGATVAYEDAGFDQIIIATGSEVSLAVESAKELAKLGQKTRVVNMVSTNLFDQLSKEEQEHFLPLSVRKRLGIEMGASLSLARYVGLDGKMLAIDTFGASAPGDILIREFGFTVENVVNILK
ncbi:MAG: transketolase [Culicoidibacterales bacterium]